MYMEEVCESSVSSAVEATAADMCPGCRGLVLEVRGDPVHQTRLKGLGIRRGIALECLQGGGGQAMMVQVLESRIALNADLARMVRIRSLKK